MKLNFHRFPGQVLVIDLQPLATNPDWSSVIEQIRSQIPFSHLVWICPGRMWIDGQKEFIAAMQIARTLTVAGGATGPTALVCPDAMALDWVGPVRSLAIPIYGTSATIQWLDSNGESQSCSPLEPPPAFEKTSQLQQITGRRPKVDLF